MCGIAGIVDMEGRRPLPPGALQKMAAALTHRGPDEDGFFEQPGLGLANRRLSIVGLADGKQPIGNEDGSVVVVYNGELFDYPEQRQALEARGHQFRTHCDTELIPHMWEDHQEGMFEKLHGQFAIALWDAKQQRLTLARDRFGICPLYWTRQRSERGDWLLFASEVKALLASGLVKAEPEVRGIDQVFNFFAVPGPASCFKGVSILPPGQYLTLQPGASVEPQKRVYWELSFPDQGQEDRGLDETALIDGFEKVLLGAVQRRLRADVPVVSYLSGGIDSSIVAAMASKVLGRPIPTFTIKILAPHLDETDQAAVVARHIGANPVIVPCGDQELFGTYPELIRAAEAPVIDTSCAALLLLARSVHQHGYKVALTGEGADEWLAGYGWFKTGRLLRALDAIPLVPVGAAVRNLALRWVLRAPKGEREYLDRVDKAVGLPTAYQDFYAVMNMNRVRFYSDEMRSRLGDWVPYHDWNHDPAKLARWDPLNRALYWGARILLPGHLLSLKGDRIAMNSSVETRYPFLDDEVYQYLAKLHPRWKLRGFTEKYLLRKVGERWLPREVAWRPKGMFRAPRDSFFKDPVPPFVEQLLSPESLRKTGYFDPVAVQHWRQALRTMWQRWPQRSSVELGLVGVLTTQLWHQIFIDGSLTDCVPSMAG